MSKCNFLDKIKTKSFTGGETVEVVYYGKNDGKIVCIVPPENLPHFNDNKMITISESEIIEEVYEVGDWVSLDIPGFPGITGVIVQIDKNPDTKLPYYVRHVVGDMGYFYWCGVDSAFKITGKL